MMEAKKALLLIGSPRLEKSTSKILGDRVMARLADCGIAGTTHFIHRAYESPGKAAAMLAATDDADILLFAFPLYVDHLPAPVIWACEAIAARRRDRQATSRPALAILVQCGFPERHQNQSAVDIMRRFAEKTGFAWAGGLVMGMGGAAGGRPLPDKPKGMLRHVLKGIDLAAADLAAGRPVAAEAIELVGRKLIPYRLYSLFGNFSMRRTIRKFSRQSGKKVDPYARPYVAGYSGEI